MNMEEQKEALQRITIAVEAKCNEAKKYSAELESDMRVLTENHQNAIVEVTAQFAALAEALEHSKLRMLGEIKDSLKSKKALLEMRLKTFIDAQVDTDDLIEMSKNSLLEEDHYTFAQAALGIKDRVTMCPIFRLSMTPLNVESECSMKADFDRELHMLNQLRFLPVPEIPIILQEGCFAKDNVVQCAWKMPGDDMVVYNNDEITAADMSIISHAASNYEHFLLQYRQVEKDENFINKPWIFVENITSLNYKIPGLVFDHAFIQFRVQAWNKGLGGPFSETQLISTDAFQFSFDSNACHANLNVVNDHLVEWDTTTSKTQDIRISSSNSTRSMSPACKNNSPRRLKAKERFTGESYTILGNIRFSEKSRSYYEVEASPDCKSYTIGVASSNIGRFDQIGKNAYSWGIHVNKWMQSAFQAKYANKVKNLDAKGPPPSRFGVYMDTEAGIISFCNAIDHECLHTFKLKKGGNLFPAFFLWFGSIEIFTGLQVPSWIETDNFKTKSPSSEKLADE